MTTDQTDAAAMGVILNFPISTTNSLHSREEIPNKRAAQIMTDPRWKYTFFPGGGVFNKIRKKQVELNSVFEQNFEEYSAVRGDGKALFVYEVVIPMLPSWHFYDNELGFSDRSRTALVERIFQKFRDMKKADMKRSRTVGKRKKRSHGTQEMEQGPQEYGMKAISAPLFSQGKSKDSTKEVKLHTNTQSTQTPEQVKGQRMKLPPHPQFTQRAEHNQVHKLKLPFQAQCTQMQDQVKRAKLPSITHYTQVPEQVTPPVVAKSAVKAPPSDLRLAVDDKHNLRAKAVNVQAPQPSYKLQKDTVEYNVYSTVRMSCLEETNAIQRETILAQEGTIEKQTAELESLGEAYEKSQNTAMLHQASIRKSQRSYDQHRLENKKLKKKNTELEVAFEESERKVALYREAVLKMQWSCGRHHDEIKELKRQLGEDDDDDTVCTTYEVL